MEAIRNTRVLRLIGRIGLTVDGIDRNVSSIKARAVLAFVSLSKNTHVPRDLLCNMLWTDADPERARTSLRQTLRRLKADLGPDGDAVLDASRNAVSLRRDLLRGQTEMMLQAIKNGAIPEVLLGDLDAVEQFLADLDGISVDLDSWIAVQRRLFRDRLSDAISSYINDAEENSDRAQAARALLTLDPTNEFAVQALMKALAESGQAAAALKVFTELDALLREELDFEPSEETIRLNADIKLGNFQPVKKAQPALNLVLDSGDVSDRPTIVMAPLESDDGGSIAPIVRAFIRDLVTILVRFREWNVVEGPSAGPTQNCYLVEGTQLPDSRQGHELSLVMKRVPENRYVWGETMFLDHDRWLTNHSMIAQRFATAINCNISADRLLQSRHQVPEHRSVFDRWIFCQHLNAIWSRENGDNVKSILESIVDDEPLFAPAHAELAAGYNTQHIFRPGVRRSDHLRERALHHSRIAVQLDPLETRSQRAMAWTNMLRGEFDMAEVYFQQALDLNGANPFTLMSTALGMAFAGNAERALTLADMAKRLQPSLPGFLEGYFVGMNYTCGRMEEAVKAARSSEGAISNLLGFKAAALWHLGEKAEAEASARRFVEIVAPDWQPDVPFTHDSMAEWFVDSFPIRKASTRAHLDEGFRAALNGTDFDAITVTGIH
ncbi:MAG: BTAD domain-containing putative transcriptional regulator [Pseudomonadota bacterium]